MSIFLEPGQTCVRPHPIKVAILGCTGSIGTQTLDVCRQHKDKVRIVALSAHGSTEALVAAAREFDVTHVAVTDPTHATDSCLADLPRGCFLGIGPEAATELCMLDEVDCVVSAVVGFAGIEAGLAAVEAHKVLAYANKESIVCGGDLLMPKVEPGQLVPVDSEHSAIYQSLVGERVRDLKRIWLTCSGGPFFGKSREELARVTAAQALAHPTWKMGAKITIDCATLANKGLEVMEAAQLFDVGIDDVSVLVHRNSRIHSMVETVDGSVKAQLGPSDMRIAIQYGLSFPERWDAPTEPIDWTKEPPLTFATADEETFGALRLAREAGRIGGTMPCVMNAANEVANRAFRDGRCGFLDIERIIGVAMDKSVSERVESLQQLIEVDARTRALAEELI